MKNNPSQSDQFNEMIINIESSMFDIEMMLAKFVAKLLEDFDESIVQINILFPYLEGDNFLILRSEKIFFDSEDEKIKVFASDRSDYIEWSNLDIATQNNIANYIHTMYMSDNIYNDLSKEGDLH